MANSSLDELKTMLRKTLEATAIPALIVIHLLVAPYTKVEESFNIQAAHDVLVYGLPTQDVRKRLSAVYDHFDFPGAVPRTFLGPVMLAGITQPIIAVVGFQHAQTVVRAALGLFNASCLLVFKSKVEQAFGKTTARWYLLLQASQFHVLFYASRTLPNMFAFGLTTLAFAQLVGPPTSGQYKLAIGLFTCATAVFRSEIAILLITSTLHTLLVARVPVTKIILPFLASFVFSLLVSVPVDSYLWQKPLWPELWGFYYNVILGSSSEWGVSPWHYYFTNALPKLVVNPLTLTVLIPLALLQPATRQPTKALTLPSLAFVAIYSMQPHKEARFIFYVIPPLTAAAALGANYIFMRRRKSILYSLGSLVLVFSVAVSSVISSGMLLVSSLNYPGGEALSQLRSLVATADSLPDVVQTVSVHADVLSCMTGVTLFGQSVHRRLTDATAPPSGTLSLLLDKTENPATLRDPDFWAKFDYVLTQDPAKIVGVWEAVGVVEGFAGFEFLKPGMRVRGTSYSETGDGPVLGRGKVLKHIRDLVRSLTGGWWVGPKMEPQVRILRRVRGRPRKEVKE